ncbi:MAG: hypothetical protein RLZ14_1412 [Actinomycetota bacterium]
MCGRFVATQSAEQVADFFGAVAHAAAPDASYNVAPTNDVLGVVEQAGERAVESFRWGLVPSWAKDVSIGSRMINARAETLAEKPSFKGLFKKRRLLVPMDGFYEWQAGPSGKTPMYIHRADGTPLAVAGLWSAWHDPAAAPDAPWLHTCTVITTSANAVMAPVHDRMPAIVEPSDWAEWLDPDNADVASLTHLLRPAADEVLTMHAVRTLVNHVRNKGRELIEPVEAM